MCWRCALGRPSIGRADLVANGSKLSASLHSRRRVCVPFLSMDALANWRCQNFATVQHEISTPEDDSQQKQRKIPIRERLRQWDIDNPGVAAAMLTDFAEDGGLSNSFTRPQNVAMAQLDVSAPLFQGDELGELRSDDSNLKPGDLVELGYGPLLHQYLRSI